MLAKRVIPTMLVRGRTLVKGRAFAADRSVGHAMQAARVHARRGVDELLILDIGATPEGRGPDLAMVGELSADCFIPITVGGGVRTIEDIDALLRAGADKVAICAAATPELIRQAADRFGSQAIVVVVEHDDEPWCFTVRQAQRAAKAGAGEIVLQSRPADGTMGGYAVTLAGVVADSIECPLIVSGGCGGPQDMLEAIRVGVQGCAAGALFQFTDTTPRDCTRFLHANGIEVRP